MRPAAAFVLIGLVLAATPALCGIDVDMDASPRLVSTITSIANPAFLRLSGETLYVSTFAAKLFNKGTVYAVDNLPAVVFSGAEAQPKALVQVQWPNEVTVIPDQAIAGVKSGILVAGGFLVPTHTNGAITLVVLEAEGSTTSTTVELSNLKKGFFYHRTKLVDMNGDGRLDILTARATKPIVWGGSYGELLWLEQPSSGALSGHWKEHVLTSGDAKGADGNVLYSSPDVYFRLVDIDNDGKTELIASVFFNESLDMLWDLDSKNGPQGVRLDATVGPAFSVDAVDLNNDGKLELLLSNHENDATKSSLWAYELVGDARDPNGWKRHTLATGFKTIAKGKGQASPGAGVAFHPHTADKGAKKPCIALAGDGAMAAYIVSPKSEDKDNWEYEVTQLEGATGVVGEIAVIDLDNDGHAELFVPDYDNSKIYVYSYTPSPALAPAY